VVDQLGFTYLVQEPIVYFPDLSIYTYSMKGSLPDVLNVGWLDRSMPFSKGTVPALFVDQLKSWFWIARVNQMRGIHECNFCRAEQWPVLPTKDHPSLTSGDRTSVLGSKEIWIPALDRTIFASPALVIHYVDVHQYCPPEEFIAAVMNEKAMGTWDAKAEFAKRAGRD
jgi:hypothetical protein